MASNVSSAISKAAIEEDGYLTTTNASLKAKSAVYGTLAANVAELVDTVNQKVRIRRTISKETSETGETNN